MRKIKVGLLGCGTVGTGVIRLLKNNKEKYLSSTGAELEVAKILVSDLNKKRDEITAGIPLTTDAMEIINDPEIEIVVEVIGGTTKAKEYVLQSLKNGKNVITANKDLMAEYGKEIFEAAALANRDLLFEGSVAGGVPIISALKNSLWANNISRVMGIVNGTTNFILTKMYQEGRDLAEVLKEAQELGYAEADPTADIEGLDAARKIAILASIAFNTRISFKDVYVQGITGISSKDIEYAKALNCTIKLVGIAMEKDGSVEARVHPVLIPLYHPLAKVDDVYNAIYVEGDAVGDVMFQGRGAGELPTASAVVSDIMTAAKNTVKEVSVRDSCTCYQVKNIKTIDQTIDKYFIRMVVADRPGVLAQIAGVLGAKEVSIDSVIQQKLYAEKAAELVLITDDVKDANLMAALDEIKHLDPVISIESLIRVEKDN